MSVFISYSRRDSQFVDVLYRLLTSKGYKIWMDREDIAVGGRWDIAVEQAIDEAGYLVLVMTPDAVASPNVADEWSYALSKGKPVVPIYLRECNVPMRLHRLQRINFMTLPFADAFRELIDVIGKPDNRPTDAIELARREGFLFVDNQLLPALKRMWVTDADFMRVAFVYSDYPTVQAFLQAVWSTLLWNSYERYKYDVAWVLRDKTTGHVYHAPANVRGGMLLHEMGLEPNSELEIIELESE